MSKSVDSKKLKILFCAAYFFSYISRQNYAAALAEIIDDLDVHKAIAGMAITASLISYGVFQIISGFFGDKFKPQKVVFVGLFGSAVINLLVWIFPNIYVMNVLWCINGIFQSLIWPPLVRLIVDNIPSEEYSVTIVRVTQGSYVATILIYLLAPLVIGVLSWEWVFALSGIFTLLFSALWYVKTKKIKTSSIQNDNCEENSEFAENKKIGYKKFLAIGILPIVISTLVAGFMRDGISTWMPTYISEVYDFGSRSSILTGAVIPLCCALFLELLNKIGEKIGNEMKSAAIFFATALCCSLGLCVFFSEFPLLDVVLLSLITVCVHGVNLMLVCNVPKRFSKYGKTSTMSGGLNSAVYAGSSLSVYLTAHVATEMGWKTVVVLWTVLISFALLLCVLYYKKYQKNL